MHYLEQESLEQKLLKLQEENAILRAAHDDVLRQLNNAYFDSLTGLRSRELFVQGIKDYLSIDGEEDLESAPVDQRREVKPHFVSLVIFNIDHFKNINESLGHSIGDIVIHKVADTIQRYTRSKDILGRIGGDEFGLAMKDSDEETAYYKADFIRQKIEQIVLPTPLPEDLIISVSGGVASSEKFKKFDDLYDASLKALFTAKNSGRDKVIRNSEI